MATLTNISHHAFSCFIYLHAPYLKHNQIGIAKAPEYGDNCWRKNGNHAKQTNSMKYFIDGLKKFATFTGRARRKEYWMFALFNIIFCIIAIVADNLLGLTYHLNGLDIGYGYLYTAYVLFTFLPGLAMLVRRLHDVGKSGWFFLVAFIPIAGAIWLLVLLCTDSKPGPNKYGPNPKEAENNFDFDKQLS